MGRPGDGVASRGLRIAGHGGQKLDARRHFGLRNTQCIRQDFA
jgi:hypothetical protein